MAIFQFFQNGTFEPVHEIQKVQKGDFLKKRSRELNFFVVVLGSYESLEGLEH